MKAGQNPNLNALRQDLTEGLPTHGDGRTGAVGEAVLASGKGRKGRTSKAGLFIATSDIVENIRSLLADSWTAGDIKRAMARKFGGKGTGFNKHIALARARNREALGRTPIDAKADSVQQWARWMAEEKVKKAKCEMLVAQAEKDLQERMASYRAAADGSLEFIGDRLDREYQMLAVAQDALAAAKRSMVEYQHTLDSILGNRAPLQLEDVTEKKAELANPTEPLTEKEADKRLVELLGGLRARIAEHVREEVTTPSEN